MKKMLNIRLHFPLALLFYYVCFAAITKVGSMGVYIAWATLIAGLGYSFIKCTKPVKQEAPEFLMLNIYSC